MMVMSLNISMMITMVKITDQEISCHLLLLCWARKIPKKSPPAGYMDHTPAKNGDDDGNGGGESDNGNVDVDDGCDNNGSNENLYDKVPHVALKMKADEQGWVRSWMFSIKIIFAILLIFFVIISQPTMIKVRGFISCWRAYQVKLGKEKVRWLVVIDQWWFW